MQDEDPQYYSRCVVDVTIGIKVELIGIVVVEIRRRQRPNINQERTTKRSTPF